MSVNNELLQILVCPKCRGDLNHVTEPEGLLCEECQLAFPIEDGIPVMIIDEAIPLVEWPRNDNSTDI